MSASSYDIRHFESIDSTNDEARRLIGQGKISRSTVVYATTQTAARGSRGRTWSSHNGNVHATYIFPVDDTWEFPPFAVYPLALATHSIVDRHANGFPVKLKWPNDILVGGKKVSGALHEGEIFDNRWFFIAGIGINVLWKPEGDLFFDAAHLSQFGPVNSTAEKMVFQLAEQIETELDQWKRDGLSAVLDRYLKHAYRLNEEIVVRFRTDKQDETRGIFRGIDELGALILETPDGVLKIYAADIFPSLDL